MIEVSVIKKENDEAFWLGANVGITESISHIPTQITEYKGVNMPLTDWEYSFFKGYLIRSGLKKTNRVCIRITDHVKSIKVGSTSGYAYIQNCQSYDGNCRFILLNNAKKKIDKQGNMLPDEDKSCYGTKFSSDFFCDLPSGQYYYREIRMFKSRLIEDDIPFTVVNSDSTQYVYIDHSPNMFRMYYTGTFTEEDVFPDLSKYYIKGDESDLQYRLTSYYYKDSNTLSLNFTYTMKPLWRISYDIANVEYNGENVDELFEFGWVNDKLSGNNCGFNKLISYDDGLTSVEICSKSGEVYKNEEGTISEDRYNVCKSYGFNTSSVTLPTYMYVKYLPTSQSNQIAARTYFLSEYPKYECDLKWDDIIQVGIMEGPNTGYLIAHNHISGTSSVTYNSSVTTKKKHHYFIKCTSYTRTTLKTVRQEESYMWDGTHDDQTIITGGDTNTYPNSIAVQSPSDAIKFIGGRSARLFLASNGIENLSSSHTLFYYETANGDIETCSDYCTHISDSGNPAINDENITKAFIGTSVAYQQIKQGYEDYNF